MKIRLHLKDIGAREMLFADDIDSFAKMFKISANLLGDGAEDLKYVLDPDKSTKQELIFNIYYTDNKGVEHKTDGQMGILQEI